MEVVLKSKRREGMTLILTTTDGTHKWCEVGDKVDVSEKTAYKLVGDYPDMLELVLAGGKKKAAKKMTSKKKPNKMVVNEANKMAKEYANKSI